MSPSEHDLRSALHRGEGDPLDVERVVAAGQARRAQRRTRLAAVAATVVVVAAAATTGGVLLSRDGTGTTSADRASTQDAEAGGSAAGAAPNAPQRVAPGEPSPSSRASADSAADAAAACPSSAPRRMLPGGGSPGQFGSDGPLFERTPAVITVCAYSGTGTVAGTITLTGRDATALRTSLEAASDTPAPCPTAPGAAGRDLAFVGVDAQGRTLRVVTTDYAPDACNARTTNGTAVRYNWTPPASLADRLTLLGASVAPRPSPSGKNVGSPVR